MARKLRSLRHNNSGYFTILFGIIILVGAFMYIDYVTVGVWDTGSLEGFMFTSEYQNMNWTERLGWIKEQHGDYEKVPRFDNWALWTYVVFEDGFEMEFGEFKRFIYNDTNFTDDRDALGKILTLDFSFLNSIGIIGSIIKWVIGLSVGIIIYLMLPFTG